MPIPDHVLRQCFALAGGRCQCADERHGHPERCPVSLMWDRRGRRGDGGWEARVTVPPVFGAPAPESCELLCSSCYERVDLPPPED